MLRRAKVFQFQCFTKKLNSYVISGNILSPFIPAHISAAKECTEGSDQGLLDFCLMCYFGISEHNYIHKTTPVFCLFVSSSTLTEI